MQSTVTKSPRSTPSLVNLQRITEKLGRPCTSEKTPAAVGSNRDGIRQVVSCGEKPPAQLYTVQSVEELIQLIGTLFSSVANFANSGFQALLGRIYAPNNDYDQEPLQRLENFMECMKLLPADEQEKFGVELTRKESRWGCVFTVNGIKTAEIENVEKPGRTAKDFLYQALIKRLENSQVTLKDAEHHFKANRGKVTPIKEEKPPLLADLISAKAELIQWLSEDSQKKAIIEFCTQAEKRDQQQAVEGLFEQFTKLISSAPANIRNKFNVITKERADGCKVFQFKINGVNICECPDVKSKQIPLYFLELEGAQNLGVAERVKQKDRVRKAQEGEENELYGGVYSSIVKKDNSSWLTDEVLENPTFCSENYLRCEEDPENSSLFYAFFRGPEGEEVKLGPFDNRGNENLEFRGLLFRAYLAGVDLHGNKGNKYTSLGDLLNNIATKNIGTEYDNYLFSEVTGEFHGTTPFMDKISYLTLAEKTIVFDRLMDVRLGKRTLGAQRKRLAELFEIEPPPPVSTNPFKKLLVFVRT